MKNNVISDLDFKGEKESKYTTGGQNQNRSNHWRERIKVQHELVEVLFVARITVLSVFFLFASLLCPHLRNEAAANGNRSAMCHLENFANVCFCSQPAAHL